MKIERTKKRRVALRGSFSESKVVEVRYEALCEEHLGVVLRNKDSLVRKNVIPNVMGNCRVA
ncbi:MAG: hypothetical protein Q3993_06550 [Filifactor alocis]|nr:hypothetical protein [Filifactor alocis]